MGEDKCDTALGLAIGHGEHSTAGKGGRGSHREHADPPKVRLHLWFPSRSTGGEDDEVEEENAPSMEENSDILFPIHSINNKREQRSDDGGARKKLRLSPEQSTLLEDSFRAHSTLSSIQKEELAHKLGLRPRQVEVWFQNRRARIKLKQTEVECEVLKGWCERLSDENRRLTKEIHELKFSAIFHAFLGEQHNTEPTNLHIAKSV